MKTIEPKKGYRTFKEMTQNAISNLKCFMCVCVDYLNSLQTNSMGDLNYIQPPKLKVS